ncbi:MAG: N-acyl-D-amino-acid deacylase family protein [Acidobacteriota bacterium]
MNLTQVNLRPSAARLLFICLLALSGMSLSAENVLLKNVVIYDGSGNKPRRGDVRIQGDKIAAVGHLRAKPGEEVRDEHGMALAPGFIDMHSHADSGIFDDLNAENVVRQGITTVFVGQDGESQYPLAEFLSKLDKQPAAMNFASMAGHGTLREQVMGKGKELLRPSRPVELEQMKRLLAQEIQAGAYGLSSGLEYDPGHFATSDEMIELSKVAAQYGGFYISHVRDEGNKVFDSFQEVLEIGRRGHLPVEISHIKLATTPVWHMAPTRMPEFFAQAKTQDVDLRADVYPYTYWQSTLRVIMLDRDYFNQAKVANVIAENGGADHIRLARYQPDPSLAGKTLDEIGRQWGVTPAEAYGRLVKAIMPGPGGKGPEEGIIATTMSEDDVRWFIANPHIMFCTDGALHDRHPRGAGAFPRVLGRYVREQKVLSLPAAIHKMTAMPAAQLGLKDRGRVAAGYVADLVLFDPATVIDESTVENPEAPPLGIPQVMVSGVWVVDGGKVTGAHPGHVLRHSLPASTESSAR